MNSKIFNRTMVCHFNDFNCGAKWTLKIIASQKILPTTYNEVFFLFQEILSYPLQKNGMSYPVVGNSAKMCKTSIYLFVTKFIYLEALMDRSLKSFVPVCGTFPRNWRNLFESLPLVSFSIFNLA